MRYRPIEERFAEKYEVDTETGCWNWTGAKVDGGYGHLGQYRADPILAHRFSYEHHIGPVPDGKIVRHTCHNPSCVNPEHLVLGTHADNMADLKLAGRRIGRGSGTALPGKDIIRMKRMMSLGWSQKDIAASIGVHRTTVRRMILRGDFDESVPRKKRAARVYLTEEQRSEAIRMLEDGERVMTVAKAFGVDRKTIRNLRPSHLSPFPRGRPHGQ